MLVLDYDLICAHILLPFVRDARPPATAVVSLHNAVLCLGAIESTRCKGESKCQISGGNCTLMIVAVP